MNRALPAVAMLLLVLPFDSCWIDFELARRYLLLLVVGLMAVLAGPVPRLSRAGSMLLLLTVWHGIRSFGGVSPDDAHLRCLHFAALLVLCMVAMRNRLDDWLHAGTLAGVLVAGYALAQRAGLEWPAMYGGPEDPVGTLGNRNVASEFLVIAGAVSAVAFVRTGGRWIGLALLLMAAALVVVASRSGLALGIGVLFPLLDRTATVRLRQVLAALLGAGAGAGMLCLAVLPGPAPAPGGDRLLSEIPSTIEVRLEIWQATARMFGQASVVGVGAGQFRAAFPPFRTAREIELSSFGHRFATRVDTAHQDFLEVAAETGVVGLLLLVLVLACMGSVVRSRGLSVLAPLVALCALMCVRSPLGNAPAVGLALACMAAAASGPGVTGATFRSRVLGLATLLLFAPTAWAGLVAQHHGARYLADRKLPVAGFDRGAALDAAVAATPGDTRLRLLRASERFARDGRGSEALALVEADLERLSREDPFSVAAAVLRAELALSRSNLADAERSLVRALSVDRRDPRAVTLLATTQMLRGATAAALATLYEDPSPALREGLAGLLAEFSDAASAQGREDEAGFYLVESTFHQAMQSILTKPGSTEAGRDLAAFGQALRQIGHQDMRLHVLAAAHWRTLGRRDFAEDEARMAEGMSLTTTDRRLLQPVLSGLRDLVAWQELLGGR